MRRKLFTFAAILICATSWTAARAASTASPGVAKGVVQQDRFATMPLSFEVNQGQTDSQVKFLARANGYTLFLTPTEAVLSFRSPEPQPKSEPPVLRMQLVGANSKPRVRGLEELPGKVSYFIGNDPRNWRAQVATYARVAYEEIYPGIDLVYYGNQRHLEYDFVVAPGADPKVIRLEFQGADKVEIDPQGKLILKTAGGAIIQDAPIIYQETDGIKQPIEGRYLLQGENQIRFQLAAYDASRPLIIDPTILGFSTYLGGSLHDVGRAIFVDAWGYAYVTGETNSTDFPRRQNTYMSGGVPPFTTSDVFVSVFQPTGSLIQSIYFGGPGDDSGQSIAVDGNGRIYVAGTTTSIVLPNALPPAPLGQNAFVAMLGSVGSFSVTSMYLGGDDEDWARGIAVDPIGRVYVTGTTHSANFPTTAGALQTTIGGAGDGFVTRLNLVASGLALNYSTFLGGSSPDSGNGIAVDSAFNAYVTGVTRSTNFPTTINSYRKVKPGADGNADAFITKLNSTGSALIYSTYIGGSGSEEGNGIAVDTNGNAYLTGFTNSNGLLDHPIEVPPGNTSQLSFPITSNAFQTVRYFDGFDAFVTKLDSAGARLVYSTFIGNRKDDTGQAIAVDPYGFAYVTGTAGWCTFPQLNPLPSAPLPTCETFSSDAFVSKFGPTGSLVYSTLLGGSSGEGGYGIDVRADGTAYVIGVTTSTDFPTINAYQPAKVATKFADAFVASVTGGTPNLQITEVSNPPASVLVSVPFNMKDTTSNTGNGLAVASTTRYRLSPDALITTVRTPYGAADLLLSASRSVPILPNGAVSNGTILVTIPTTVATGAYFLGACADDGDSEIEETQESDNCRATSIPVLVINPAIMADLVIDSLTPSLSLVSRGANVNVTDTTANIGNASTRLVSTTEYRLSSDTNITSSDLLLGTRSVPSLSALVSSAPVTSEVNKFARSTSTGTVTIPSNLAKGAYFLAACTDSGNLVVERDEKNNCRLTAITVN